MTSPDSEIDRTRSIFGVKKVDCAVRRGDWGVEKKLDGAINWIGGEGDNVIVSRALITSSSNSYSSMPERISSDKLPTVNARSSSSWVGAGTEGEIGTESGVAVNGGMEGLRVCGKRKEHWSGKVFFERNNQQCQRKR